MEDLVELEAPGLLLIVHDTPMLIFRYVHIYVLQASRLYTSLTLVFVSIWRFFEAKLAVGLVLMTTLTLCFTIYIYNKLIRTTRLYFHIVKLNFIKQQPSELRII